MMFGLNILCRCFVWLFYRDAKNTVVKEIEQKEDLFLEKYERETREILEFNNDPHKDSCSNKYPAYAHLCCWASHTLTITPEEWSGDYSFNIGSVFPSTETIVWKGAPLALKPHGYTDIINDYDEDLERRDIMNKVLNTIYGTFAQSLKTDDNFLSMRTHIQHNRAKSVIRILAHIIERFYHIEIDGNNVEDIIDLVVLCNLEAFDHHAYNLRVYLDTRTTVNALLIMGYFITQSNSKVKGLRRREKPRAFGICTKDDWMEMEHSIVTPQSTVNIMGIRMDPEPQKISLTPFLSGHV